MKTVKLKGQEWATENYNGVTFRNGDLIPYAKTPEDYKEFTSLKKPCFTYYNYDEINSKYGCCYNWFSLIDKRGLAPEGFKVPDNEDFSILFDNYIGRDRLDDDKREDDETRNKLKSLKVKVINPGTSYDTLSENLEKNGKYPIKNVRIPLNGSIGEVVKELTADEMSSLSDTSKTYWKNLYERGLRIVHFKYTDRNGEGEIIMGSQ